MLKIGDVLIKKTAALAPMASVADFAYRSICKEFGACYLVSEMVSVKGLCYNFERSAELLRITDFERPMAIQIFGSEPEYFLEAMPKILMFKPNIVDVNMGCPVPKVVKSGAGCALMKNVKLAEKIVSIVVKNSSVPVTVKIRKGWNEDSVNACEFAKRMEACGASAITIHGRTKVDMFSKNADWDIIAKVKKSVDIPVIANGDVKTPEDAKSLYDFTGADLIMVGRGSFGRPWIFSQIDSFLKSGDYEKNILTSFKIKTMLNHVKRICEDCGEEAGMKKARAHAIRYFYGFEDAAAYRNRCSKLCKFSDILKLANELLRKYE